MNIMKIKKVLREKAKYNYRKLSEEENQEDYKKMKKIS